MTRLSPGVPVVGYVKRLLQPLLLVNSAKQAAAPRAGWWTKIDEGHPSWSECRSTLASNTSANTAVGQ